MEQYYIYGIICCVNFLLGSFPTSFIVVKLMNGIDIREYGSKNPGATNVYRVAGTKAGIITLAGDILKGVLAVFFTRYLAGDYNIPFWHLCILVFMAVLGHTYSVFLKFKGGKGVATAAGVFAGLAPAPFITVLLVFILIVWKTQYVSLASMVSAALLPFLIYFFKTENGDVLTGLAAFVSALVIFRHRENIKRLIRGEERKIGRNS